MVNKVNTVKVTPIQEKMKAICNFYTTVIVCARPSEMEFEVRKVLMNSKLILNLILLCIAHHMKSKIFLDNMIAVCLANEDIERLKGYVVMDVKVAGIKHYIKLYVILGNTNYSMLLG